MEINEIKEKIENNVFNKQFYSVSLDLKRSISGLFMYTGVDGDSFEGSNSGDIPLNKIFQAVPDFQRENNKWTKEMQSGFIENLLCGYKTEIMLFEIGNTIMSKCQILDGLQRITAIYKFLTGDLKAFGQNYNCLLSNGCVRRVMSAITLRVYSFDSKNDAIDFYVGMNKNITHSPEDIEKALSFKE